MFLELFFKLVNGSLVNYPTKCLANVILQIWYLFGLCVYMFQVVVVGFLKTPKYLKLFHRKRSVREKDKMYSWTLPAVRPVEANL